MRRRPLFVLSGLAIALLTMPGLLSSAVTQPNYAKVKAYRIYSKSPFYCRPGKR